ncbi:MAG: 4Fe-4S dicluster domain-containing protein [Candidatus Schekmanbacteria bacterium]|nr:MAG: 4Fe-4S dicluster domain-containing protein [Candidatus Schekmanbacteria bacterium]
MAPTIDKEKCIACGCCIDACTQGALELQDDSNAVVDEDTCIDCYACVDMCPVSAISQ